MKKKYIAPTTKVHKVIMPQILAGSEIEQGGESGGGNGTLPSNSMESDFEE
jgi:hypothetical protein